MAVDLICPDCGGVIGAKSANAEGREPCMCNKPESDGSDTVSIPAPSEPTATPTPNRENPVKLCLTCGKDLAGHRRVKDSRGYQCYECAKNELKAQKEGTIPCAECKRRVKEAGLFMYEGKRICKICFDYHKDTERLKKKVDSKHYDAKEKRTIIILGVVFGILCLILIWRMIVSMMG